jgi:ankyrin repeat protein
MQGMTPLIYACSCEANMEDEVRLLLAHNADPQHVLHADNVPYKTALEAAAALKHESIVAILANAETENNQHSDEPVTRGSFFTTLLTKKQLEQDRQKVVHAIELSDILQFKKMIKNENINVDDLYHNEKYGSISFLAIALNQYFLQKELFHNIVPQNENTSQTLKNWVFVGYEAAKTILFDLVEKKPNLNIGYTHPVTNELVRGEKVLSTPLKEAIKRNDLSLMLHLVANGADLNYKGESDEAITPIELAQQSSHPDLLNVILKISREEDVVPLEGRDKGSQEKDQDEELTE